MAKKEEIDFDAEIARLKKQREAKKVATEKAENKRLALRAAKIKRNERKAEATRQNRRALIKSMTAVVSGAQKVINLNGGGEREEALLNSIIAYSMSKSKPVAVKKERVVEVDVMQESNEDIKKTDGEE